MFKNWFGKATIYTQEDVTHLKHQITEMEHLLEYAQQSTTRATKQERISLATKSLSTLKNVREFLDKVEVK